MARATLSTAAPEGRGWGLSQLVVSFIYLLVLARYRAPIPLLLALMVVEYAVRLLSTFAKPFELAGTAPDAIGNWLMLPLAAAMVVLSPRRRGR